jgi:UDP-N-acetylmuramyl tripeptide synthase
VGLGSLVGAASRALGGGEGTVIGGRVCLALDPGALASLARGVSVALVSGTNGKTTTTRLLCRALSVDAAVATNEGGSNLATGLVTALAHAAPGEKAALEVDEGWLPGVIAEVGPVVVVLLNLTRDQLDRVSEVRMLASRWRTALAGSPDVRIVANADDPIVAWAAGAAPGPDQKSGDDTRRVTWVAAGQPWRADAAGCPACEGRIRFEGPAWSCADCGLRRPDPDVCVDDHALLERGGGRLEFSLSLPGRFNRANAAMAAVAAGIMGVERGAALAAMSATTDVAGRYEVVSVEGIETRLLLAKNPAGWVGVFDLLAPAPAPVVVSINARVADGRDPSWLWDVDFERLSGRRVVATGERAADLGVRLHYAGVAHTVVRDPVRAVVSVAPGPVEFAANYTAFQDLRRAVR